MNTVKYLTRGACIAALYAAVTLLLQPISFGPVQFRISEALTLLPFIMPEAVWGLTLGCFIANIFGGSVIDVIFGTLATLAAAIVVRKMKNIWLLPLAPVIINSVVIGGVVTLVSFEFSFITYITVSASIALSEAMICWAGGIPLLIFSQKLFENRKS